MRRFFLVNWKVDSTTLSRMHQAEIKNKKHGSAVKRYRGQKSNGSSKREWRVTNILKNEDRHEKNNFWIGWLKANSHLNIG